MSTSFRLCWTDKLYQRSCCDKFVQKKLCVKLYLEKVVMTNLSSKVRCQKLFPGNYMHNFLLWKILCTKIMYISYSFPKVESCEKKSFQKRKDTGWSKSIANCRASERSRISLPRVIASYGFYLVLKGSTWLATWR